MARTRRRGNVARKSRVQTRRNNAMKPRVQSRRNNAVKKSVKRKRPRRSRGKMSGGSNRYNDVHTVELEEEDYINFNLVITKVNKEFNSDSDGNSKLPSDIKTYYYYFVALFGKNNADNQIHVSREPSKRLPYSRIKYELYKFSHQDKTFIVLEPNDEKMMTVYYNKEDIDCYNFGDLRDILQASVTQSDYSSVNKAVGSITLFSKFKAFCRVHQKKSEPITNYLKMIMSPAGRPETQSDKSVPQIIITR